MARIETYQCDNDYEVLYGKDRGAYVNNKSYIHIKGTVVLQMYDEESRSRYHVFLTPRDNAELSFHMPSEKHPDCIGDFVRRELDLFHNRRKARLMEEVSQAGGSEHIVRTSRSEIRYQAPAPAPYRPQADDAERTNDF